jgi:RNase H-fold protein (predicted Holliday junction resolvase)
MAPESVTVLAIDPGTHKCGIAVLRGEDMQVLHRSVIATEDLVHTVTHLSQEHTPSIILLGNGTSARRAAETVRKLNLAPIELVDEVLTSVAARQRFFKENPPKGLRRLLPTSLQTPSQPYDDYVAIILAERYLADKRQA